MGRARAQAGAPISTTGAAQSPFSGAFGGMGGLEGLYAQQQARRIGVQPGNASFYTDPLRGVAGVGAEPTEENIALMSQAKGALAGGRSFYGPERMNEREMRLQSRRLQQATTAANRPQYRLPSGNFQGEEEVRGPEYYREQRNRYLGNPMMFSQQGGLRSAASRALMG